MRREGLEQLREPLSRIAGGERSGPASLGPAGAAPGAAAKAFPSPGNDPAVPRTGGFEQGGAVRRAEQLPGGDRAAAGQSDLTVTPLCGTEL